MIEDYLEQGRAVASFFSGNGEHRPGAAGGGPTPGFDPIGQWWRASRRLGEAWLELLGAFAGGPGSPSPFSPSPVSPRPPVPGWQPSPPPRPEPWGGHRDRGSFGGDGSAVGPYARGEVLQRITYEIASTRPVRVSLDLDPQAELDALAVGPLPCRNDDLPPLDGVRFEPATDTTGVSLRLAISADAAEALYAGRVVDSRSGQAVGVLSLQILPAVD